MTYSDNPADVIEATYNDYGPALNEDSLKVIQDLRETSSYLEKYYENEKRLRLRLNNCTDPFCLDTPWCVCGASGGTRHRGTGGVPDRNSDLHALPEQEVNAGTFSEIFNKVVSKIRRLISSLLTTTY